MAKYRDVAWTGCPCSYRLDWSKAGNKMELGTGWHIHFGADFDSDISHVFWRDPTLEARLERRAC